MTQTTTLSINSVVWQDDDGVVWVSTGHGSAIMAETLTSWVMASYALGSNPLPTLRAIAAQFGGTAAYIKDHAIGPKQKSAHFLANKHGMGIYCPEADIVWESFLR